MHEKRYQMITKSSESDINFFFKNHRHWSELDKLILEDEAEIDQYLSDFCDFKSILKQIEQQNRWKSKYFASSSIFYTYHN